MYPYKYICSVCIYWPWQFARSTTITVAADICITYTYMGTLVTCVYVQREREWNVYMYRERESGREK